MIKFYAFFQSFLATTRESEKGQTMAEYAVVLAVITVAIVATLGLLAGGINKTPEQRHQPPVSFARRLLRRPPSRRGTVYEAPLTAGPLCVFRRGSRR